MSKARTLADFISDGSEFADGTISVAEVSGAAPLASPTFTGTASGTFSGPLTGNVTGNVTGDLTGDVTGNVTGNLTGNVTGDVAGDIDLSAIAATIADTAVDIFVYDTRKDSDGGAWRKRTQHTSWYNETLNTSTRGSRKEFPAVAVIVAESNQVTIYDGDDPDLPMWMVFNVGGSNFVRAGQHSVTSVTMENGVMCCGTSDGTGGNLSIIWFISDKGFFHNIAYASDLIGSISERNDGLGFGASYGSAYYIVSGAVNDVAMTVLPNAPIDAATGLPVPTIAVATDGGVSVIKDDGTVVDITGTTTNKGSSVVSFDPNNKLFFNTQNSNGLTTYLFLKAIEIPSSDTSNTNAETYNAFSGSPSVSLNTGASTSSTSNISSLSNGGNAVGFSDKLTRLYEHPEDITKSMVAYTSSSYNTGWMNGDIKLATLSDTDSTNVTGSELVTNGTFDTDLTGWTISTDVAHNNGTVELTNTTQYGATITQTLTGLEVGKRYILTFHVIGVSGNYGWYCDNFLGNYVQGTTTATGTTFRYEVEATSTSGTVTFKKFNAGTVAFDNISVRLAEEDRSVNGKGLQVFGTVTKSAVATGADLVAYSYSSSSTSNYLWQPYNTDLAFGTNDFGVMFWTKAADYTPNGSGTNFVLSLDAALGGVTGKGGISIASSTANDLRFQIYQNGYQTPGRIDCIDSDAIPTNTWNCICAVRRSGVFEIWLNGKLKATNAANLTADVSNLNTDGWYILSSNQGGVSMALLRASATAPSPEQIKKIYEDEKVLFQENAQATLYGSSDAVTALAYDDSTDLLHVGTSAGRSVFQGLRRVDNTTTAVGAAISASNSMVAED